MTVHEYAQQLHDNMLASSPTEGPVDLVTISKLLADAEGALLNLKSFVRRYTFSSVEEEIAFFKEIKPLFVSQLVYHQVLFEIHARRIHGSNADFDRFCDTLLRRFETYLTKHNSFFQYCMSGDNGRDRIYFTRDGVRSRDINVDEMFTTGYDSKLGRFLAYQLARDYVHALQRKSQGDGLSATPALSWTESKVSLIELAYALYASRALDNGKVSVKHIIEVLEKLTGLDLSNYRRIFADIRLRKTGPINFLDKLSRQFSQYIDGLDH